MCEEVNTKKNTKKIYALERRAQNLNGREINKRKHTTARPCIHMTSLVKAYKPGGRDCQQLNVRK
jgi:hypothetical protein